VKDEKEIRALVQFYIAEYEGGQDPFNAPGLAPQEQLCLWCVRLRVLKWVLGELPEPDNGRGMTAYPAMIEGEQ
jgi:hypothetical protein